LSLKNTLGSLLIYVLAGLSLVGLAIYVGFYHPDYQIAWKWVEFTVITAIVFGVLVQAYWGHRRSVKLWSALLLILILHTLTFSILQRWYEETWPLLAKTAIFTGETMLLILVLHVVLGVIPYSTTRHG
jgi:peptidoglycan/LPS O-acetylase OafA/YrhL